MEQRSSKDILSALAKPFAAEDLEWRLQQTFSDNTRGLAIPYVTNRAIQNRLDDVLGPDNWYNDYKPWHGTGEKEAQLCGISIYFEGRGFVTKWDGAEDTDIEPVKGGLSDSMKRAACQWGIGRILYSIDGVFVDVTRKGKSYVIKPEERQNLDNAYLGMLKRLGLTPASAGGIQSLLMPKEISDDKTSDANPEPPKQQDQSPADSTGTQMVENGRSTTEKQKQESTSTAAQQSTQPQKPEQAAPYEYMVFSATLQKGMSGQNTQLVLSTPDGKRINAFARGVHPALQAGIRLTGTKLKMRKQDSVVFYLLEDYRIAIPPQAA